MSSNFALLVAVNWAQDALLGTAAIILATIAIAALGLLMMQGRIPLRRGATAIFGCFLIFGSPVIARGIAGLQADVAGGLPTAVVSSEPPLPIPASPSPGYDPYAGASVPERR